jgi:hypothetical protein
MLYEPTGHLDTALCGEVREFQRQVCRYFEPAGTLAPAKPGDLADPSPFSIPAKPNAFGSTFSMTLRAGSHTCVLVFGQRDPLPTAGGFFLDGHSHQSTSSTSASPVANRVDSLVKPLLRRSRSASMIVSIRRRSGCGHT